MKKLNTFFVENLNLPLAKCQLYSLVNQPLYSLTRIKGLVYETTTMQVCTAYAMVGEEGDMIQCDESDCPYSGWFYDIYQAPEGSWYYMIFAKKVVALFVAFLNKLSLTCSWKAVKHIRLYSRFQCMHLGVTSHGESTDRMLPANFDCQKKRKDQVCRKLIGSVS